MTELLTVAEVAALLRHPSPASDAAARMVRRQVALGLPRVEGMRPPRFVKAHVLAWLDERSRSVAAPAELPPPVQRPRSKKTGASQTGSALDAEIARLRKLAG